MRNRRRLWIFGGALLLALAAGLLARHYRHRGAPDSAAHDIAAAQVALAKNDGIAAEADLTRALAARARREDVAARMGAALLLQGDLDHAREWLGPGAFARGDEALGWRMRGRLEQRAGNLGAAGAAFDKALAFAPRDPQLWVDIGRLRYAGGEQVQALDAAIRAVTAGPDDPRALEFRAQLLRDSAGPAAALPLFEHALDATPNDPDLLAEYAATLGEAGRGTEMLVASRKLIGLRPHSAQAYYLQAVTAARAGNIELARQLAARLGERMNDVPAAQLLRGVLELEAGNANVAAGILTVLANRQGANQRVQLLLARALYEAGQDNELIERYGGIAARGDTPAYLLTLLARAYENKGDRAAAAPLLDRAAAASVLRVLPIPEVAAPSVLAPHWSEDQGNPGTTLPFVRALLAQGDNGGAGKVAARYLTLHPGSADGLSLAGDVELAAGNPAAALGRYAVAAKVRAPDTLMLRMTEAYDKAGRGGEGARLVLSYLGGSPQDRLAIRLAGSVAAGSGQWARARTLLETLVARGGGRDVRLLADLSLAQLRVGDAAAALASANRASALQGASGVAAQARAMALVALGQDLPQAAQLLDKARRLDGDNPLLTETRKALLARQQR